LPEILALTGDEKVGRLIGLEAFFSQLPDLAL
jgi:hypothetical protein